MSLGWMSFGWMWLGWMSAIKRANYQYWSTFLWIHRILECMRWRCWWCRSWIVLLTPALLSPLLFLTGSMEVEADMILNKWVDGDGDGCLDGDGDGALEVGQIYWRYSTLGPHGFPPTPYGCALGHWGRNTFVIIVIMIMVVIIIIITIIVLILIMIKVLIMMIWSPPRQPRYPSLLFCPSSYSLCSASCPPMM